MKVRFLKNKACEGIVGKFEINSKNEILCLFNDNKCKVCYTELEIYLSWGIWKSMKKAFIDGDLLLEYPNFKEALAVEERELFLSPI